MKFTVLIIDDEEKIRTLLARIISLEGFDVLQAHTYKSGLKALEANEIDVVICDVKLPDGNGVDLVGEIKEKYPAIEVILLTAYGNIPDSVQAIKHGAFDYITKGDDNNRIIPLLYKSIEKVQLNKKVLQLEKQLANKYSFSNILGKSKAVLQAIELAKKVAPTDTTVLLTGETGTGKEVFAQAIHQSSQRAGQNFVAINCAAFSKDLLEGELFGHKAGSFTGAAKDQKGLLEEAHNGTLFLDEIGEMPLSLQAKILRVIENNEFIKIGEAKTTKVNVRIITATNRNLKQEIEKGNFREDLYYRLSVFEIKLPSLKERKEDIPIIAKYFAENFALKTNKKNISIGNEVIRAFQNYPWPGNIREIKNIMERSIILMEDNELRITDIPFEISQAAATDMHGGAAFSLSSIEKQHIQKILNYTKGNKTEAARLLEIGVATLYRKIEEYAL